MNSWNLSLFFLYPIRASIQGHLPLGLAGKGEEKVEETDVVVFAAFAVIDEVDIGGRMGLEGGEKYAAAGAGGGIDGIVGMEEEKDKFVLV